MPSIFYMLRLVGLGLGYSLTAKASVIVVTLLLELIKALILLWSSKMKSDSKYRIYIIGSQRARSSKLVVTNMKVVKTITIFWLRVFVSIVPFVITVITDDLAEVWLLSIAIFLFIFCWGYIHLWGRGIIFLMLSSLSLGLLLLLLSFFGLFEFFNLLLVLLGLTLIFENCVGLLYLVRLFIVVVLHWF